MYFTLLLQGRTPLLIWRWRLGWIYHDLGYKVLKCLSNRLNIRPWTPRKISDRPCPRLLWRTSRVSQCPARVPADSALSGKTPASIKSYFSVCTSLPAFREIVIIVESREQWQCEILKSCVNTRGHLILSGQLRNRSAKNESKKGKMHQQWGSLLVGRGSVPHKILNISWWNSASFKGWSSRNFPRTKWQKSGK